MPEFVLYMLIPITSAIVGWGTNVLALKMTFFPLRFVGIKPFGWQGIIPSKAQSMAERSVDLMTTRLLSVEEVFNRLDAERVADEFGPALDDMIAVIVTEIMEEQAPRVWSVMPSSVQQRLIDRVRADARDVTIQITEDMQKHVEDVFDLKQMVVSALVKDPSLLNDIFLRCGKEEFPFIEKSGIYFGFLFGLIQMTVWIFYQPWWLLPLAGLLVGYATNYLAIRMIFEPQQPARVLGLLKWHGLFHKRQAEVAAEYGNFVSTHILNPSNIGDALVHGAKADKLLELMQRNIKRSIDEQAGITKPFVSLAIGTKKYALIREKTAKLIIEMLPDKVRYLHAYAEEAFEIDKTLREKMAALPADEFEELLRPVFKEDEWKLIATGAFLGMLVGIFQLMYLFGGTVM